MMRSACAVTFGLAVLVCGPAVAEALLFESRTVEGRKVLVVRDCGRQGFNDGSCPAHTQRFSEGDARRLRAVINRSFHEVWLISGGGNLHEGVEVGKVLREFQASVRVPRGYRCVSACTVAFMGGFFRTVDEGASYEVHAASAFLGGFDGKYQAEVLDQLKREPSRGLEKFATNDLETARHVASRLLVHFQQALLPQGMTGISEDRLVERLLNGPPSTYLSAGRLAGDVERLTREGVPSAQETLMRIERGSMAQVIEEVRPLLPGLGPRADKALDMLEAMYSSRIIFTAPLSRQTLEEMGYVTVFVEPRPQEPEKGLEGGDCP
jgi:hypothetical protein